MRQAIRQAIRLALVALCVLVVVATFIITYGEVGGAMTETFWGRMLAASCVTVMASTMLIVLIMVIVVAVEWVMEPSKESDND